MIKSSVIGIASAILGLAMAAGVSSGQGVPPHGQIPPAKPQSAESSPEASKALQAKIQRAVADLGNEDFTVRERASRTLWLAGAEAEPALQKALRENDDFEIVYRARLILDSFQLGVYADTPAEIVMLVGQFRMGNFNVKQMVGQRLRQKGKTELLQRLIAKESNPEVREQLRQFLLASGTTASPFYTPGSGRRMAAPVPDPAELAMEARRQLAEHNFGAAERLLRNATDDASVRDYSALLLGQGKDKLDAAIARLRTGLKAGNSAAAPGTPGQRRLAWMLRAKGDLAGAVAAAKAAEDNGLAEDLLAEMADWKELAKIDAKTDIDALAGRQDGPQRLARIMLFRHLAGEKQAYDEAAATAMKLLKQRQFRYGNLLSALLLSGRVDEVIAASTPQEPSIAFELLVAQDRFQEAFRLAKIDVPLPAKIDWPAWLKDGKDGPTPERRTLAHRVVRALRFAGEEQQAQELIAAMLATLSDKQPEDGWEGAALLLMDLEVAVGRAENCDALAAKLLALDFGNPEVVISRLYYDRDHDQDPVAVLLWKVLRKKFPAENVPAALRHLRRILTGKPAGTRRVPSTLGGGSAAIEELAGLAPRIESEIDSGNSDGSSDDETSDPRGRKLLALATLCHRYGQRKLTAKYLALIGTAGVSTQTLIDAGNLYGEESLWAEAAKSYEAAWTKDRRSAAALYLWGWARTKRGEEAEGRKLMDLALLVPLGDGESRHDLIQTLVRLHQDDEAERQGQLVLRLAALHDRSIVQALMEIGDTTVEKAHPASQATAWQRDAVELLGGNVSLTETRYYINPPAFAHAAQASVLLRAGKTAEAIEELHRAETIQPSNIQVALDCDADLRKQGAANEAEALYRRMLKRHETLCRDFPRCGTAHNDLAWLAANLDRDLDKALAHAQRAVELEPQSAGILDTLAEVHFRRGNRAEAVRLAKRCLEMEPDGKHYRTQLARFETQPAPAQK